MTTDPTPAERELAEKIARDLFTDGTGAHANRLVMEHGKEHLRGSGWREPAVVDRVLALLSTHRAPPSAQQVECADCGCGQSDNAELAGVHCHKCGGKIRIAAQPQCARVVEAAVKYVNSFGPAAYTFDPLLLALRKAVRELTPHPPSPPKGEEWRARCRVYRGADKHSHTFNVDSPTGEYWLTTDAGAEWFPHDHPCYRKIGTFKSEPDARAALAKAPPPPDVPESPATPEPTKVENTKVVVRCSVDGFEGVAAVDPIDEQHVCGASGYGLGDNDRCRRCEAEKEAWADARRKRDAATPRPALTPAQADAEMASAGQIPMTREDCKDIANAALGKCEHRWIVRDGEEFCYICGIPKPTPSPSTGEDWAKREGDRIVDAWPHGHDSITSAAWDALSDSIASALRSASWRIPNALAQRYGQSPYAAKPSNVYIDELLAASERSQERVRALVEEVKAWRDVRDGKGREANPFSPDAPHKFMAIATTKDTLDAADAARKRSDSINAAAQ